MVSKAGAGPQREKIALRAWLKATALAVLGARAAAAGSQGMGPENESRSGSQVRTDLRLWMVA